MKLAYLVIAHRNLPQVARLVGRLAHGDAAFYVHVDRKVPDADYRALADALTPYSAVLIEPRVDVMWGGYSLVRATLAGLATALRSGCDFDYVHLLSGQDYPLVDANTIIERLGVQSGREFFDGCELSPRGWKDALYRYERYHLHDTIRPGALCNVLETAANALLPNRTPPRGYTIHAGEQWWSMTAACARYVVEFVRNNRDVVDFFRWTECPDEMFFHTIVLNSRFGGNVLNDNLRYVDWSDRGKHPKTLTLEDFPRLVASGKLFARKFDSSVDAVILDHLDDHAGVRERPIE